MNAAVRSMAYHCQAAPGQPCTANGDHLARYLRAEAAGTIGRDLLTAVIATLDVLPHHVVIPAAETDAAQRSAGHGTARTGARTWSAKHSQDDALPANDRTRPA